MIFFSKIVPQKLPLGKSNALSTTLPQLFLTGAQNLFDQIPKKKFIFVFSQNVLLLSRMQFGPFCDHAENFLGKSE